MDCRREDGIRKGPWKAEEDEVLLNHVKKCGPRDWSSIRSKGLLQRTGKSCRLRWVNKLRPNLKNGCKFTVDEERVVIELQAQFGNKWARIATYLRGRTDNDVKNFWSSRQKRLARILQTSAAAVTPSKSHKTKREVTVYLHDVPTVETPKFSGSSEGESSSQAQSCSSQPCNGSTEIIKMVPLPDLVKPEFLAFEPNPVQHELTATGKTPWIKSQPLIPFLQHPQHQTELVFSTETQELLDRLDPYFTMFGPLDASELGNEELVPPFLGPLRSCGSEREKIDIPITPDCIFDDFPEDMFDQIEPLPDPSEKH